MKRAFDKTELKNLELKNRFLRSATWEGLADEQGRVTYQLIELHSLLAQGNIGLVIAGFAFVRADGQAVPHQTGLHRDDLLPGLSALTAAVHKAQGLIAAQIAHGGLRTNPELAGVEAAAGPSAVTLPGLTEKTRELSLPEITAIIEDFGRAAARVRTAGFDAVQIHAAHGYLLNQFLSPRINRRGDRYGGNLPNRARIVYETYEAIRGAVGPDFPVFLKINAEDFIEGGLQLDEAVTVARNLVEMGLDLVEVSGGGPWDEKLGPERVKIDRPDREAYFRKHAAAMKDKIKAPTALVGGLRSPTVIEEVLSARQADYVSLSRPLIREPRLIQRWADGDLTPAACISCNKCFDLVRQGQGLACAAKDKEE